MSATAFLLAAGHGTRLRPLTLHRPKPLVPVCGVPMLDHALALARRHGHAEVIVNAHWLAPQIHAWAADKAGVRVADEGALLGTAGGLRAVRDQLGGRVAVINADVLTDVDLTALGAGVPSGGACLALRPHPEDAARYGVVAADAAGVVTTLSTVARIAPVGAEARDTHYTGVCALDPALLDEVPEGEACLVRQVFAPALPARRVRGLRHAGSWLDVGDPAAYLTANLAVLTTGLSVGADVVARAAFARMPRGDTGDAPPAGVVAQGAVWLGAGVHADGAVVVRDSVVGHGATLAAGTSLTRCVVWDGAAVPPGDHVDSVFHDGGVLRPYRPNAVEDA